MFVADQAYRFERHLCNKKINTEIEKENTKCFEMVDVYSKVYVIEIMLYMKYIAHRKKSERRESYNLTLYILLY